METPIYIYHICSVIIFVLFTNLPISFGSPNVAVPKIGQSRDRHPQTPPKRTQLNGVPAPAVPRAELEKPCKVFTGWWLTYPSEKYESQLGSLFPTIGENKTCSKPPTRFNKTPRKINGQDHAGPSNLDPTLTHHLDIFGSFLIHQLNLKMCGDFSWDNSSESGPSLVLKVIRPFLLSACTLDATITYDQRKRAHEPATATKYLYCRR